MEFKDGPRKWTVGHRIGPTGLSEWAIRAPCVCGGTLELAVHGSLLVAERHRDAECTSSDCKVRIPIPKEVWKHAKESADKAQEAAWRTRAANGGPRGAVPI